jgi:hypothetical protein
VDDDATAVIDDNGVITRLPDTSGGTDGGSNGGTDGGSNGGTDGGSNGGDSNGGGSNGGDTNGGDTNGGGSNGGDSSGSNGGNTNDGGAYRSSSHSSTSGGVVAGVLGMAGGIAWMAGHHAADHWYLEGGQALTLEAGDAQWWAAASLEHVSVDPDQGSADVELLTRKGALKRHLAYRDGADGVKHFVADDASGAHCELSLNAQTNEYFYTERGAIDGKAYTVTAHGWLKPGAESARLAAH